MGKDEGSVLGREGARIGFEAFAKDSASFVLISQSPLPSHYFVIEMGGSGFKQIERVTRTSGLIM